MTLAYCPRCNAEYPPSIAGLNCGQCLINHAQVIRIVLRPPQAKIVARPANSKLETK